jgi:hypothetical protein
MSEDRAGSNGAEESGATTQGSPTAPGLAQHEPGTKRRLQAKQTRARSEPGNQAEELNSVRPHRVHRGPRRSDVATGLTADAPLKRTDANEEPAPPRPTASTGKAESDPWTVPQQVRDRFRQDGNRFYFPDGSPAFRDHGRKLSTASENTEVIYSLIEIARSRGWQEISVEGTERFRQEAWRQGRLAGLAVRGYNPSLDERSEVIRGFSRKEEKREDASSVPSTSSQPTPAPQSNDVAEGPAGRKRTDELIVGKLIDHGREFYRFDAREGMSYFVRIDTPEGERTLWGKDLQRALEKSLTQPKIGDEVAMRRTGSDPVTVKRRERDADGHVLKEHDLTTQRQRWLLEKREFFETRARAAEVLRNATIEPRDGARSYPMLAGSYLNLHGAELAARTMRDREDRKKFLQLIRNALADSIARGDPLQPVRLRERSAKSPEIEREQTPALS